VAEKAKYLQSPPTQGNQASLVRPDVTTRTSYKLVPIPEGVQRNTVVDQGVNGAYRVTFVLGVPGFGEVKGNVNFDKLISEGTSLIRAPEGDSFILDVKLPRYEEVLEVLVGVNQQNFLQYLQIEVVAPDLEHAHQFAYEQLMPTISRWSFRHDVGISVNAAIVLELASGITDFHYTVVGQPREFSDLRGRVSPDHHALMAAYREGASTLEPSYQALSFYRVIEGCYLLRFRRRENSVRETGRFDDPGERFPSDYSSIDLGDDSERHQQKFEPHLNKKFTKVRDEIRGDVRNALAHLDINENPLVIDTWQDMYIINRTVPVLRYMARTLLTNELDAWSASEEVSVQPDSDA
jgi:hypothetical protein